MVYFFIQSGLTRQVLESSIGIEQAQAQVLEFIQTHVPEPQIAQLAGNSVHADKRFLEKEMPQVVEHLHYRIVGKSYKHIAFAMRILLVLRFLSTDVSTVKELARRWYPEAYEGVQKKGAHRAMGDIIESIEELKFYREQIFR
jgi:oligoribonuclease